MRAGGSIPHSQRPHRRYILCVCVPNGAHGHAPRQLCTGSREALLGHMLQVMNDDLVQPHRGFGTHPHRNMEIITYIVEVSVLRWYRLTLPFLPTPNTTHLFRAVGCARIGMAHTVVYSTVPPTFIATNLRGRMELQ